MSDERHDDEILGRALSRAIETQDVEGTPYERSRLAVRPLPRGVVLWQLIGAGAVTMVLALAFGAWFTRPIEAPVVATSPTPTPIVTATHSAAPTATPSSATPRTQVDHQVVYFARDGLPPIGLHFSGGGGGSTPEQRIQGLLTVLARNTTLAKFASHDPEPPDAHNVFPTSSQIGVMSGASVKIQGDLATVDFDVPGSDWKVRGAAQSLALLQELVYTATEEPGISRVLFTENGGKPTRIDQIAIDKPLSREDVSGYASVGPVGSISDGGAEGGRASGDQLQITTGTSVKVAIQGAGQGTAPAFAVYLAPTAGSTQLEQMGKYVLTVIVGASTAPNSWIAGTPQIVDETPVRARIDSTGPSVIVRQLILDDARPWRVYRSGSDVVVEVGGDPRMVSDRIALADSPSVHPGGTLTRTFTVAGAARTFEANVVWDVKDASGNVVANGHTTASLGTSAIWGTFSTQVTLPATVTGNVTLRVYEVSPKDGTQQGVVSVPLVVR